MIIAFFPCIHFCDAKTLFFQGVHIGQKNWSLDKIMDYNIQQATERHRFFSLLLKLTSICSRKQLRMILENPWNSSGVTFLQSNFVKPTIIDKNRMWRGDYFIKPTAYRFFGCTPLNGFTYQLPKEKKVVMNEKRNKAGQCSKERSLISPDYARNFICDFILGKEQKHTQLCLF